MRLWKARQALGSGLISAIAISLAICFALAALHYYEQDRRDRAGRIVRDIERASQDLSLGFLHVVLSGQAERAWQREQGLALLTQALREFERALVESRLARGQRALGPEARSRLAMFGDNIQRFKTLLPADGDAAASDIELRLALYELIASANRVEAILREDLHALQSDLDLAFLGVLTGSILLLGLVCVVLYRAEYGRLATLRLLESISEGSTDSIFAKDQGGRYLLVNRESCRVLGRPAESVLGRTDRELFPGSEADAMVGNDTHIMQIEQTRTFEEVVPTLDGNRTFLVTKGPLNDSSGKAVGVFGIGRDISERKAAEALLEESRKKLEQVIESLHEGLIIAEARTGEMHWNRAALSMHGYASPEEQRDEGKELDGAFEVSTLEGEVVPFEEWPLSRVRRGEELTDLTLRVRRRRIRLDRIFSYSGTLVRAPDGELQFSLLSINDVTLSRRAEESLRHSQRLEALGTLSAGVAHDFNNILFAISGNTQLAEFDLPPDSPAREHLAEIARASARATDLVRRILLFARSEDSKRTPVELWPVVDEALRLLRSTVPASIQVTTRVRPPAGRVRADSSQIHQVITNLVANSVYAISHSPSAEAGHIEIEVANINASDPIICHGRTLPPGGYAHLSVRDNGSGMDTTTLRRVFDPFFTTKAVGEGTGLGLSMVHGIISRHEGAVAIESEPGQGTRVHIYLPLVVDAKEAQIDAEQHHSARGLRILFVDDEKALVRLAERGLGKMGHLVRGFGSAEQALRVFEAEPDNFDIVVTDLSMPDLSGFEVARQVMLVRPSIPVLMMSGFVRSEDRERAKAMGIRAVLVKPSPIEVLANAIERARAPNTTGEALS